MRSVWDARVLFALLLGVLLFLDSSHCIRWLALSKSLSLNHWNQTVDCRKSRRMRALDKTQVDICKSHLELMKVVARATRDTVGACQNLFQQKRWNCSSVQNAPNYDADLTRGSREQAFVYALSAAALTQSVSKACSLGTTTKCACGQLPRRKPPENFKWGGCGDDVNFGVYFSKTFADAKYSKTKRKRSKRNLMNLHNNEAGRKIVTKALMTACKCHGVSGSCSIKTCWKALPDVRKIGQELLRQYSVAVEVKKRRTKQGTKLLPTFYTKKRIGEDDLIYYTKSPDYCLPDRHTGSPGTSGRRCDKTAKNSSGCRSMCCGRGYTTKTMEIKHRCECKYYWCCYVKCKTCMKKIEINSCK